jgi:cytidylate kinase
MKWITVSRKMGVHGSDIARRVASDLGYRFYDTEAISHMAQELGVLESVRAIDEKAPSFFQRIFSHRPIVYLDRPYSVLYEVAKQGDAVFLGRGSHLLLRDFRCALHVWVTASPETRIRTLLDQGWTREAAARALKRSDDERSALVKFAFGVDWEDPVRYDLVLNMDKLTVNVAVSTVLHVLRSPDISDDSTEAVRALGMLALAHRAEAALMESTGGQGRLAGPEVARFLAPHSGAQFGAPRGPGGRRPRGRDARGRWRAAPWSRRAAHPPGSLQGVCFFGKTPEEAKAAALSLYGRVEAVK